MFTTVLRNYQIFRSAPGLWVGLYTCIVGIFGMLSKKKLQRRRKKHGPLSGPNRSPQTVEAFAALSIVGTVMTATLITIHGYILWLVVKILNNKLGFYEPTYRLCVILLFALSIVLEITSVVNFVGHVIGTTLACKVLNNQKSGMGQQISRASVPMLKSSWSNGSERGESTPGSTMTSQWSADTRNKYNGKSYR